LKNGVVPNSLDYISLSDVPSYFSGVTEREFMQWMKPYLKMGAHIVLRHYLRKPEAMNLTGFRDVTVSYQDYFSFEKVQMYECEVYKYVG
jgi:S-adenosylmethionine-diacylglycerol 3-amino-3-carboxypropyl transferase